MDSVTIEEKVFQVAGTFCGASEQPKLEPEDVPQENLEHPLSYSTVQNGQNHVSPHNVLQPQLEESPKQPDQEDQQQHDVVCVFYHLQRHQSNDRQDRGIADEEDEMREPRRESYLGVNQLLKQQAEQEHQSKEQEHQQDSMLFTSARTCRTRGKERLLEEDDFSLFHRCDTSQKESMPTKEQYPFPCGTHISSFADLSVPAAAHEFEYSSTRHGLRNEGVINAAQVLAAGKFSGTHEVVAMDYHVVPNEEQTVKSDEHTLTARGLDEMPWRTSQVITQQLEVPIADTQNVTSASVVTVPKAIENLHSYETATTAFRVFNNSPACPEQVATGFENFNDRQNAEEVPTHAALRVSNQSQLSEDASVAASIYRSEYFTDDDDTSISSENSRKNGHEIPFDICYKDDTAESQQQAHARSPEISFAEGSTGFKQERHDPNMAGADPYFEEAAGIKFLEIPAAVESKIKTEILSHPMFPEMLSAHVACLRVTVPQDHMLDLPGQLTRSQELLRAYSAFMPPNEGKNVQPREQLDEFMKSHTDALWNLHARLEHCIPHFVRDAMLFISKVENEAKSLLSLTEDQADDAFESNTTGMAENDYSLWGLSKSEEYGPLVPTASERSIMERIREQLKQELTEEGYKKKIMEVRDEILRKRRAGKLPTGTTTVLKEWWKAHMSWPYPTEEDKESLMEETGLELKQINNWFINQRKRNWNNGASSSKSNDKKNKHKA